MAINTVAKMVFLFLFFCNVNCAIEINAYRAFGYQLNEKAKTKKRRECILDVNEHLEFTFDTFYVRNLC